MTDQTPEEILDNGYTTVLAGDGQRSIRSKTGQEHLAALTAAGYLIVPIPTPTEGVCADQWTDQWKPTAPASMSSRQAAMEILAHIDWATVIEDLVMFEDMDPLVYYGLRSELFETKWLDGRWFMGGKVRSHLTAWATSWMKIQSWCVNEDHHDGDMIPFNDCFHGDDDESPCEWGYCWALDGDPDDFLRLAMDLMRDGWEPPTDRPIVDDATRQEVEALCAFLLDAGSDERICNAVDRARELLSAAYRMPKHEAGRTLDGRTWDEFPDDRVSRSQPPVVGTVEAPDRETES